VAVPGISGREPKEVSIKSLAYIIQSRMEEIIDAVIYQLEESDCMEKLTAGIVLTGGGSLMRHLPQLVKYRTGLDVRIGKPDVQLLGNNDLKEVNHPMYSTSVGLLLKGFENAIPEPIAEPVSKELIPEFVEEKEETEVKEPRAPKKIGGFIESIKNTFDGFFDDGTDRKM